ncbi:MAG: IS1380 family transposase [Deltaproteobacteria bacterium]|nr:IS1380 family transposase [Deltaproteobacteria bacterium]
MRLTVARLRRVIKRDFSIQFGREQLTSYGGLELLRRFLVLIGLKARIQCAFAAQQLGGDYGASGLVLLVIGLLVVGGRRLGHLRYVAHDPLFARLCGLSRIPTDRTVVHWLKQFTQTSLRALMRLNSERLYEQIEQLKLPRLTIDLDGTVICTGAKVAWAARGFNPHHRKASSYYPLLAHLAQTGQVLRLKNRPGNVHDSKGAEAFVRELLAELRERFGRSLPLELRMDAAFFQQALLKLLIRQGCLYAVKVPFCQWTGVKALVAAQSCWSAVGADIDCFETRLALAAWGLELGVVVYRKRVQHRSPKNYQLDLFSPDDGYFEYSAVATNLTLTPRALWYFAAGRGAQEKTIAELKGEFALDAVPTNHYGANSAWQQLCVLAHNLMRSFQLHLNLATPKPRSRKRTYAYRIASMKTLRFLLINRAARLARISGRKVLRFSANPATESLYDHIVTRLAA